MEPSSWVGTFVTHCVSVKKLSVHDICGARLRILVEARSEGHQLVMLHFFVLLTGVHHDGLLQCIVYGLP